MTALSDEELDELYDLTVTWQPVDEGTTPAPDDATEQRPDQAPPASSPDR